MCTLLSHLGTRPTYNCCCRSTPEWLDSTNVCNSGGSWACGEGTTKGRGHCGHSKWGNTSHHLISGLYTVTFVHCTGCTLCRLPDISDRHAAAGSKHACTWQELAKLSTWYRWMLSSPLLHAYLTSSPWRNSCTEFTPHCLTLVMSVIRTIKVPFLLPLTDENKRVWLGGSLFSACTVLFDRC